MDNITEIEVNGDSHNLRDSYAATTGHVHTTLPYQNFSSWGSGSIGTVCASNNNTTTAIQLANWGSVAYYNGYVKNKNALGVSAVGTIADAPIMYTITITAAKPWHRCAIAVPAEQTKITVEITGEVKLTGTNGLGTATRTVSVGGINHPFHGCGILNTSSVPAAYYNTNGW